MDHVKTYRSFTRNPFDIFRILIYGFLFILVLIIIIFGEFKIGVLFGLMTAIVAVLMTVVTSYTEVKLYGKSIQLITLNRNLHLNNLTNINTWWSYDFGGSTVAVTEGSHGQSRPLSNKINCFVEFKSSKGSLYIFEQIQMGSKFPDNHEYKPNTEIDKSILVKVWDIDKCLEKLEL